MKNLAGHVGCDSIIRQELIRTGVPVVPRPGGEHVGEVAYTIMGKLGKFEFRRAWYYWMVQGPVPLSLALALWDTPIGKTDIRVNGHCGCPKPGGTDGGHVDYIRPDTGTQVWPKWDAKGVDQEAEWNEMRERHPSWPACEFADDPATVAEPMIMSYHIDSELGLYLFVKALKEAGLVPVD